jgi:hypothetical protein
MIAAVAPRGMKLRARGQVISSELPHSSQGIRRKTAPFIFVCGFTLREINVQAIAYAA